MTEHGMGCPYKSKFFNNNIVREHAQMFAKKDGILTDESIKNEYKKQGIAQGVNLKKKVILNMFDNAKILPQAENITIFYNPASTGIWDKNGNFDEEQFNKLCEKSIIDRGKRIITKQIVNEFLYQIHGDKNLGNATNIFHIVPVSWKKITDGSFDELFKYYNDYCYLNKLTDEYENALTVDHLWKFYTEPVGFMQMRIDGRIPIKPPPISS